MSVHPSVCLAIWIYLPTVLTYLSIYLSTLSIYLSTLSVYQSIYLYTMYLSIYLSIYLPIYLPIYKHCTHLLSWCFMFKLSFDKRDFIEYHFPVSQVQQNSTDTSPPCCCCGNPDEQCTQCLNTDLCYREGPSYFRQHLIYILPAGHGRGGGGGGGGE